MLMAFSPRRLLCYKCNRRFRARRAAAFRASRGRLGIVEAITVIIQRGFALSVLCDFEREVAPWVDTRSEPFGVASSEFRGLWNIHCCTYLSKGGLISMSNPEHYTEERRRIVIMLGLALWPHRLLLASNRTLI